MKNFIADLLDALRTYGFLQRKKADQPITDMSGICLFVTTRSAFIAQKTLYGYMQTRMGLNYPIRFQDKDFAESMRIGKMHIYAACASDLTIWCIAQAAIDSGLSKAELDALAEGCYRSAIQANLEHAPSSDWASNAQEEFTRRLLGTQWQGEALSPENFILSPKALVQWSPIEEVLKRSDAPIVQNSIKFAWMEVRESFLKLMQPEAMRANVRSG
jgi:hypothetical protein